MKFRQIFTEALKADNSLLKFHDELVRLRSEGVDRETLMSELKTYHDELESEADQDLILEALDFFYGWCRSDLRID